MLRNSRLQALAQSDIFLNKLGVATESVDDEASSAQVITGCCTLEVFSLSISVTFPNDATSFPVCRLKRT